MTPTPPPTNAHDGVPAQLGELLRFYRRHGVSFDAAWMLAVDRIQWPGSRREETSWREVLRMTREGWRATYEGWAPEVKETAVGQLAQLWDALGAAA